MTDRPIDNTAAGPDTGSTMPSLRTLANAAFYANAPFLAYFLLTKRLHIALSIAGGLVLGMVLNSILYFIVNQGAAILGRGEANPTTPQKLGQTGGFAGLTGGKFIITGGLMFVMVVILKLNVYFLAGGFLLTQIAVTLTAMKRMMRTRISG